MPLLGKGTPKTTHTTLGIVNKEIEDTGKKVGEVSFQENPLPSSRGNSEANPNNSAAEQVHADTATALLKEVFDTPEGTSKTDNAKAKKRMSVAFKEDKKVVKGNATALHDYLPMSNEGDEVAVVEGEKLSILHGDEKWTCIIKADGSTGFVPTSYIDFPNSGVPAEPQKGEAPILIFQERTRGETWIDNEGIPGPPPPTPGSMPVVGNHHHEASRTKGGTVMEYDADLGHFVKSTSEIRVMEYNEVTGVWGTARPRLDTIQTMSPQAATMYKKVAAEPIPDAPLSAAEAEARVGNHAHETSRTIGGTVMTYDAELGQFTKAPSQYRVMEYNEETGKWGTAKARARLNTAFLMSPDHSPPVAPK